MIRKAVLPVAGLGTRCLPASKAIPKEMMTVVDRPVIQWVVEEAIASGITEIILVTHSAKKAIEDHFDVHYELETELEKRGKTDALKALRELLPDSVRVISVRQGRALGLGHAILCAKAVVGDEPFAVLLPDVLVAAEKDQPQADLKQLCARYEGSGKAQILVDAVPTDQVDQYGIAELMQGCELARGEGIGLRSVIEKPSPALAPSNLAVVGRYVLPAEIFSYLEKTRPGAGNEIQLTDALDALLQSKGAEAYCMQGRTYDCGNKLGYLRATLAYARDHAELGDGFMRLLDEIQRPL